MNEKKGNLIADANAFNAVWTAVFGKSNEQPQSDSHEPKQHHSSDQKPLKSKNSFIEQLQKAQTDDAALLLLQNKENIKSIMHEKIKTKHSTMNLLSFLINKNFFDSATWLVNNGADLNTRDIDNSDYSSFMLAVDLLTTNNIVNNKNTLEKATTLCTLMVHKGGNINDVRNLFDQAVVTMYKPLKEFLQKHDTQKDPLARKLFDLKNSLACLKGKLGNLKHHLNTLKGKLL